MASRAITLHVVADGDSFQASCDFPSVHTEAESEQAVIERASAIIRGMLAQADSAMMPEPPRTLIVHVRRNGSSAVIMQPLEARVHAQPKETG